MDMFHRHKWDAIDVTHGEFAIIRGNGTLVLYRCECGKAKSESLNGTWTLAQLTTKRAAP